MENIDPVGVHTIQKETYRIVVKRLSLGVVAPSQTLGDKEYQMLRTSVTSISGHFIKSRKAFCQSPVFAGIQNFVDNYCYLDKIIMWFKIVVSCLPAAVIGQRLDQSTLML